MQSTNKTMKFESITILVEDDSFYSIQYGKKGNKCSCDAFVYRKKDFKCKHMLWVDSVIPIPHKLIEK